MLSCYPPMFLGEVSVKDHGPFKNQVSVCIVELQAFFVYFS